MDPRTVIVMLAMNLLCTGALLHLIGRRMPAGSGVHDWGGGAVLFGLAYVGRLALGLGSSPEWALPLDGAMATASLMFVSGLRGFTGRGRLSGSTLLGAGLVFAGLQGLLLQWYGAQGRHVLLNLVLGLAYAALSITAVRALRGGEGEGLRAPLLTLTIMVGGLGGLTLARSATILFLGPEYLYAGAFAQAYFVYASLAAVLLALTLVWMVFLRLNRQLAELAIRDPLTRLYNRDGLTHLLGRHFARRDSGAVYVLQGDVDHFKHINDRYGHAVGDAVLIAVAAELSRLVRGSDVVARTGGEEFVVLAVDTDQPTAQALAERLRQGVAALPISVGGHTVRCTISIGVSERVARPDEWAQAWREADKALYHAKAAGRDRVEMFCAGMTLTLS